MNHVMYYFVVKEMKQLELAARSSKTGAFTAVWQIRYSKSSDSEQN